MHRRSDGVSHFRHVLIVLFISHSHDGHPLLRSFLELRLRQASIAAGSAASACLRTGIRPPVAVADTARDPAQTPVLTLASAGRGLSVVRAVKALAFGSWTCVPSLKEKTPSGRLCEKSPEEKECKRLREGEPLS